MVVFVTRQAFGYNPVGHGGSLQRHGSFEVSVGRTAGGALEEPVVVLGLGELSEALAVDLVSAGSQH